MTTTETDSSDFPAWLPDEYDPTDSLADRLRVIAEIDGGIELHVGNTDVTEIVGQPQHVQDTGETVRLSAGASPTQWKWEIVVPNKGSPRLDKVDSTKDIDEYMDGLRTFIRDIDVRIYGVDTEYLD